MVPFWKKLGRQRQNIHSMTVDMSSPYTKAISESLPQVTLVYDHFHVIKPYDEKLSDFR